MAERFALLAALFFAISHILIRRGLVNSNALTGSFISFSISVVTLWFLVPFFVPFSAFWNPAIWYFIVGGIFAPGLGRILSYIGIERIGVARSVPIVNASPMFASILAVLLVGEIWTLRNILGTSLIILGVVILSVTKAKQGEWSKTDVVYPLLAAVVFGISTNLRKLGLTMAAPPLMGAAVSTATAFLFALIILRVQGGWKALALSRPSCAWFFAAGLGNTASVLLTFYALNSGKVVVVEPLICTNPLLSLLLSAIFLKDLEVITSRVVAGAICTVAGTILVVTQ